MYNNTEEEQHIFDGFKNGVLARAEGTGQGWALAWRISLRARIGDGQGANEMLKQLLTTRTSPNLFDQHPPFQIDGNFGATAGIAEMLIFSHDGAITLLPAIPDEWASGQFTGFKARGNFTVDMRWEQGIPEQVRITSNNGGILKVRNPYIASAVVQNDAEETMQVTREENDTVIVIPTIAGQTYTITSFNKK